MPITLFGIWVLLRKINNYLFVFVVHNFKNTIKGFTRKLLNQWFLVDKLQLSLRKWRSLPWLDWPLQSICVTNDHGYVPFVVTIRSFPHSWLITGFLTRRMPLVKQELLALLEHLNSLLYGRVDVVRSLIFLCKCL